MQTGAGRGQGASGRRSRGGPAAADELAALADRGAPSLRTRRPLAPRPLDRPRLTGPKRLAPRPLIRRGLALRWLIGPKQRGSPRMPREPKAALGRCRERAPRPVPPTRRQPASRETPRSANSQRGQARPAEEEERRGPE